MFSETSILDQFDTRLPVESRLYYPGRQKGDLTYQFFLDLEHGYCETVGSRIHLYADEDRWAVVAEKSGYFNRADCAQIQLDYFGNCINYSVRSYSGRTQVSNMRSVTLITEEEWDRICNQEGEEMDTFEVISPNADYVMIRDQKVLIERDISRYRQLGIHSRKDWGDVKDLVTFEDLLRYIHATHPELLYAQESEIRQHIPADIPRLMTIDDFHFSSGYVEGYNPAEEELYQLIAKVLVMRDPAEYRPTLPVNNHWSNWESGHL